MDAENEKSPLTAEQVDRHPAWGLFERHPVPSAGDALKQRILARIQSELDRHAPPKPSAAHYLRFAAGYGAAAAAMILLAVTAMLLWGPQPGAKPPLPSLLIGSWDSQTDPLQQELDLLGDQLEQLELSWNPSGTDQVQWNHWMDRYEQGWSDPFNSGA